MAWWGWAILSWAFIASLGVVVLTVSLLQHIEALHELTADDDVLPESSVQDEAATGLPGLRGMPA